MGHSTNIEDGNHLRTMKKRKFEKAGALTLLRARSQPGLLLARAMAKRGHHNHNLFLEYYCRFQIISTLGEPMDVERTLAVIKKLIRNNFQVQKYSLMLLDESRDELLLRSHFGIPRKNVQRVRYPLDGDIGGEVIKRRRPIYVPDLQKTPSPFSAHWGNLVKRGAFLVLPLLAESGRVVGVAHLFRRQPNSFSDKEIDLLRKLANQAGQVIDTIAVYQHTRELSFTDELTRVFNRRYFNQRIEREIQRAQRYGRALSLIMLDIDHFKIFNDTHGHLLGDAILKQVAEILDKSLRKADILARFGGEEFVILLPEIDKEHGCKVAEKLRGMIERADFPNAETQPFGRITISLGLASFPEDAQTANELLEHADQGLYRAKSHGRNQIGVYEDTTAKFALREPRPFGDGG
ncbi:MAG: sensor domain-containing diguanylate cyclase [candidate division KSB1 bacterium]|nr:sensor domain-containing diguanylate cyclase [candidate division KSB1 bacterium]MDZ7302845.1 sensor domain-containing diguanylate cyclase [candidate division KSB1 bacterium]MDZ7311862.1 sensor domain-containing diguanylate cyclase [candidate division KSB1 bacterium]